MLGWVVGVKSFAMIMRMAWRNIWRNRVRSLVIIISVVLGLAAGIFVLGMYDGMLRSRVRTVIDKEVSHLQLHHPKFKEDYEARFSIENQETLVRDLSGWDLIAFTASRSIAQGMLATSSGSSGVQINGICPEQEENVSQLHSKLIEGKGFLTKKKNQVLIGRKLAAKLELKLGSKLVLTLTDKNSEIVSAAFRVAGIYQTNNSPMDEKNVYVTQADLNSLLQMNNECHELAILLKDDQSTEDVRTRLIEKYPDLRVETWNEISPETRLMIDTTDQYSIIFIVIIMLALMFGIINTMLMAILERTREIGMLVALGMNKVRLFSLVVLETILLTLAGVPPGFLSSWLIIGYYNKYGIDISSVGGDAMSSFGFSSLIYPEFPWTRLFTTFCIVFGTALFASMFPSYKALRLEAVEAMRQ